MTTTKTAKPKSKKADPLAAFNFREGGERLKVLRALFAKLGRPVKVKELHKISDDVNMSICVIPIRAKRLKLPYTLLKIGKGEDRAVILKRMGRA